MGKTMGGRPRLVMFGLLLVIGLFGLSGCDPSQGGTIPPAVQAINFWFGGDAWSAIKVARCESGLNPNAVSPGGANLGLFQINVVHRVDFERVVNAPWSMVFNPWFNSMYAAHLFHAQGWGPWSCKRAI
jgi:Transglycosylase SLT domain